MRQLKLRIQERVLQRPWPQRGFLVGDIGGTNSTFAIADERTPALYCSFYIPSKEIKDFTAVVQHIMNTAKEKYNFTITKCCFAGAGPVSKNNCRITHLPWSIDGQAVQRKTRLKTLVINDFEAVGYGIPTLPAQDLLQLKPGKSEQKQAKAVLGAGTGLGKGILLWNEKMKNYLPLPSEGGHADAVVQGEPEFQLWKFIKSKSGETVAWEDLLSGKGIINIYTFLQHTGTFPETKASPEIERGGYLPERIAAHHRDDPCCQETMRWFLRFYARCAKNFALDVLPKGGLYIAGGIAAKNKEFLIGEKLAFQAEFVRSNYQREILERIPIYLITNHTVSLHGAAVAARLRW